MTEFSAIDPTRLPIPFVKSVFEGEWLDGNAAVYGYADGHEQFTVTKEGVFWQQPQASTAAKDLDPPKYKISGPLVAIGKNFDSERSETGLYLRFMNQSLKELTTHILRQDLKHPQRLLEKLYGLDFYLNPEWERKFVLYLSKLNPKVTALPARETQPVSDGYITPEQIKTIQALIAETGVQTEVLLKHFKVPTLDKIPSQQVGTILKALEGKKRQAA
jgi:hypothetical protein